MLFNLPLIAQGFQCFSFPPTIPCWDTTQAKSRRREDFHVVMESLVTLALTLTSADVAQRTCLQPVLVHWGALLVPTSLCLVPFPWPETEFATLLSGKMSFLKSPALCTWNVSPAEKESKIFLVMVDVKGRAVKNLTLVPRVRRVLCWDTWHWEEHLIWGKMTVSSETKTSCLLSQIFSVWKAYLKSL